MLDVVKAPGQVLRGAIQASRWGPDRRPQHSMRGRDGNPASGLWRAPSYGLSPRADRMQRGRSRPERLLPSLYTPPRTAWQGPGLTPTAVDDRAANPGHQRCRMCIWARSNSA